MKRLSRLLLSMALSGITATSLWAQTTVTNAPASCVSVAGPDGLAWANPPNAQTQNAIGATRSVNDGEISDYLQCSNYGFTIPDGNRVTGITATIRRQANNTNVIDDTVVLLRAGAREPNNLATTTTYSNGSYRDDTYGGTGNLWGAEWSINEINATGFGLALAAQKSNNSGGARTVNVDVISLGVTYVADNSYPIVSSMVLADPSPTNGAATVSWTVTFSKSVTGVNAADFALVQAGGVSGASITSVSGSGATWTVTAGTGTGTGTLGLNLVDDDSIRDLANNRLGGTGIGNGNFTGAVYTVTAVPCNPPSNIPAGVSVSCVCDNFNRASLNPSTIFGQNWITSTSDGTGILPSIVASNYLRLTNNTANNAKAATVPAAFPAAGNYISVEFLHYAYNGSGADGIAVTLSDYNVPAVPGAYGGSLGYAQRTGINGFAGGWIGVALDEYGNYQNPTEGRNGGPGFRMDSVGVRGSGSGTTGYPWLSGTAANLSPGIDAAGATPAPGYRYQIVVDARNAGSATPQTIVSVNRDTGGTGASYASLISPFDAYSANPAQAPVPANWQISFTGSTGGANNIHEIGGLRICAQTIVPPNGGVASGFAVIDEAYGTPAIAVQNYLTGRIYTKLAGTPFKLNVAAINNNQIQTGYALRGTKTVNVKLVDNRDGVCVLNSAQANYCSAACQAKTAVSGGSQTLRFVSANAGQKQSTDFTIPDAWSNLVAIVGDDTTTACSTDAFSVRPLNFNTLSSTASNAALTGTPALRAGSDSFSMTVGTATAGYAGAAAVPTINPAAVTANAAGWTVGTLSPASFPAATASSSTGSSFTYSEVGHFRFLGYDPASNTASPRGVYDRTWTAVDQGAQQDCITGSYANTRDISGTFASNTNYGKYGCLFGITANSALFGRFIPDRFTLVSGSVTPSCTGTTRNFTYMGQARLGVAYQLEARNGFDAKTVNYDNTLYGSGVLPAPALLAEDQTAANQGCELGNGVGGRLSGAPTATWAAGVYTASTATASFSRPGTAAPGTLDASTPTQCTNTRTNAGNPFWNLDLGVLVTEGTAVMAAADMNAGSTGTCSGAACNAKKLGSTGMVLGRLNLLNAYGSDALPLLVPVRAEYWNGTTWQLNADDRCTTLGATTLAVGNVTPASGSSLNVTSASLALSPAATMSGGVTNFRINPSISPSVRGAGSVDLVLNLGAGVANSNWCGSWTTGPAAGTGTAPSPDLSFLLANWCGSNADRAPAARIRFGSPTAPYIYLRERY
ncbi:DUF6701 domain-containing protein [Curvibacter fontanus]